MMIYLKDGCLINLTQSWDKPRYVTNTCGKTTSEFHSYVDDWLTPGKIYLTTLWMWFKEFFCPNSAISVIRSHLLEELTGLVKTFLNPRPATTTGTCFAIIRFQYRVTRHIFTDKTPPIKLSELENSLNCHSSYTQCVKCYGEFDNQHWQNSKFLLVLQHVALAITSGQVDFSSSVNVPRRSACWFIHSRPDKEGTCVWWLINWRIICSSSL